MEPVVPGVQDSKIIPHCSNDTVPRKPVPPAPQQNVTLPLTRRRGTTTIGTNTILTTANAGSSDKKLAVFSKSHFLCETMKLFCAILWTGMQI